MNPLPAIPTISAGTSTTFCQGGSVTLTSTPATSYLWSTGSTLQSISVNSSGTYSVIITNANGCTSSSAGTIVTVNPFTCNTGNFSRWTNNILPGWKCYINLNFRHNIFVEYRSNNTSHISNSKRIIYCKSDKC
ncbi:MAG: hypothetical protein IPL24_12810 [Bacteroidetes bacterium]|nr:hypothetical protein [Bacteroidota bacterium]